jgi:type II secretory pathway component PulC
MTMQKRIAVLVCCSVACAPAIKIADNPYDEELNPRTSLQASGVHVPPQVSVKTRQGKVKRSDVLRVLDAGPGVLLQDVQLDAVHHGDSFDGWKIQAIVNPNSPAAKADLIANDVVISCNGLPLGRPDQLIAAWNSLRTAPTLSLRVERDGNGYELRFEIDNDVLAAQAQTETPPR